MNKPAIKQEASGEYNLSLIMPDQLMVIWKDVEKYLRKSCKRSKGRTTTQDIFYECLNRQSSLWIIFDTGSMDIIGCLITQISHYPSGKRMLNLDHITGNKMGDWIDRCDEVMEKWAKDNKCSGLEGVAREGFWHWIKDRNWKKTAIFVEYNFEDNI